MRNFFVAPALLAYCIGLACVSATAAPPLATDAPPATIGSVVPLEMVNDLKAQPLALLAKFPSAGNAMARYVADTIRKDPSLVDSILSVVRDTSPEQAAAIGAGLVRGIRAMGSAQIATSRSLIEKIVKSDNPWLKTTFLAIGPRTLHGGVGATTIVPPPAHTAFAGAPPMGTTLPDGRSRMGPEKHEALLGAPSTKDDAEAVWGLLSTDGMVVAMLLSDANHNGAISTSPTQ